MWSGAPTAQYAGNYYRLSGVHPGPRPVHDMGIWIGGYGPRVLKLIGRAADGWVCPLMNYVPPGPAAQLSAVIDGAAHEAHRPLSAIRRIYIVPGRVSASAPRPPSDSDRAVVGPVDHWVQVLVTSCKLAFQFERRSSSKTRLSSRAVLGFPFKGAREDWYQTRFSTIADG